MGKDIILISSSPREDSNSDILCDEFIRGAEDAGHSAIKIRLAERDISYCTGCCSCIGNQGSCIQQDDMNDIMQQILHADVMVLASPVYFRSFNGQMKTFIDRICPIYTMIHDKDVYYIISAAGGSLPVNSTIESFRTFTGCLDVKEKGTISVTGIWGAGGVRKTAAMNEAFTMGKNI